MSNLQEDTELREQINKQFTHVFVQGAANSASVLYAAASEQEDANEAGKRIQDICNKYTEEILQLIHSRDEQRAKEYNRKPSEGKDKHGSITD